MHPIFDQSALRSDGVSIVTTIDQFFEAAVFRWVDFLWYCVVHDGKSNNCLINSSLAVDNLH